MRGHRVTPPPPDKKARPLTTGMPQGTDLYRRNKRYYWTCGNCGIEGGGQEKWARAIQTLRAHDAKCRLGP